MNESMQEIEREAELNLKKLTVSKQDMDRL